MFAIVEIAGKQHKVSKGDVLKTEKLKANKGGIKLKRRRCFYVMTVKKQISVLLT